MTIKWLREKITQSYLEEMWTITEALIQGRRAMPINRFLILLSLELKSPGYTGLTTGLAIYEPRSSIRGYDSGAEDNTIEQNFYLVHIKCTLTHSRPPVSHHVY